MVTASKISLKLFMGTMVKLLINNKSEQDLIN